MKMQINSNRKLLILALVVGLIALFSSGFPFKVFTKLSVAEEYKSIESEYENMRLNLTKKIIYEKNQEELMKKINELNIDTVILQDKIISDLGSLSRKNNIDLSNIKFSEIMPLSKISKSEEELEFNKGQDIRATCMKVTVDFDSNFDDALSFVDSIKDCGTEISITDISMVQMEDGRMHVVLNLMFYALPIG